MEDYLFFVGYGIAIVAVVVVGFTMRQAQKKGEAENERLAKLARKRAEAAKSVARIRWTNQFVVDDGVIDEDHKTLFGLINKFNEGIIGFRKPDQMMPLLTSFTEYLQTHFKREEELQAKSGFPFLDEHREEHEALIARLGGLKQKALAASEDNITDVAVEIAKFLQDWLTAHVIDNDLPLKPYVDRMREEAEDTPALAAEARTAPEEAETRSETAAP